MAIEQNGLVRAKDLGKGFAKSEQEKKINVAVDGTTVTFDEQGRLKSTATGGGGLDCAAIDALPSKPWKKGTVVLAKQDGQCVKLATTGDIFTDVVTNITANKTSTTITTGTTETINLSFSVQNAGANPATNVELVITKPTLGTYQLGTVSHSSSSATGVVKVNDLRYTVATLASGGSLTVTVPVIVSREGSFSFGAQATSTIDTDATNNNKTVTISVTEKAAIVDGNTGNYVPTVQCPLFRVTDLEYSTQLNVTAPNSIRDEFKKHLLNGAVNIYSDKRSVAGRRLKFENAEQIMILSSSGHSGSSMSSSWRSASSSHGMGSPLTPSSSSLPSSVWSSSSTQYGSSSSMSSRSGLYVYRDFQINHTDARQYTKDSVITHGTSLDNDIGVVQLRENQEYTYNRNTGIITFANHLTSNLQESTTRTNIGCLTIWVKPAGENCNWQLCIIKFTNELPAYTRNTTANFITNSNLPSGVNIEYQGESYGDTGLTSRTITPDIDKAAKWIGSITTPPADLVAYNKSLNSIWNEDTVLQINAKAVVKIKKGTSGTFTLTATDTRLKDMNISGAIKSVYNADNKTATITLTNVQPANAVKLSHVEFVVID